MSIQKIRNNTVGAFKGNKGFTDWGNCVVIHLITSVWKMYVVINNLQIFLFKL